MFIFVVLSNQNLRLMKIFSRCNLPESITYNGKKYVYLCGKHENKDKYIGKKCVQVNVLSRRLKNATDLHGNPYKPSEFIFICEE